MINQKSGGSLENGLSQEKSFSDKTFRQDQNYSKGNARFYPSSMEKISA